VSTRQAGNRTENAFCRMIEGHGYCTFPSRGSRGVDVLCVHSETCLCIGVEVGGSSKVLRQAFPKLRTAILPAGSWRLVVRRVVAKGRAHWHFYTSEDERFTTLDDALDALRRR